MVSRSYYYIISLIFVCTGLLYIYSLLFFRIRGKTFVGNKYLPGIIEEKRLKRASSADGLAIAVVILLAAIANLLFSINYLLRSQDHSDAHFIIVFAPIACVLLFLGALYTSKKKLGGRKD